MTTRSRKALIIGAGIAGPVTAILLGKAGIDAQVFEAWPHSTGIGGGLQIAPNGMHVLAEIGLADEMIRRGSIAESFDFYSQSGLRLGSVNRNMQQRFGQPAVNMCRATLNEAILARAQRDGIAVNFEKRLVRIEDRPDQPVVAHFADGSSAEGDFLIGADGVHSAARTHVIPDGPKPFDTGLIGFGGFVPRSLLDGRAIGQRVETTFGQSGFFGYGFCSSDPRDGVMWWSTQPAHGIDAASFRAMGQDAMKRHLRNFHAGWHDPIPQLLEAAENIVVTATLDVATLADLVAPAHAADRRCRARHQSACRPGRFAGARGCHAARPADAGGTGTRRDLPEASKASAARALNGSSRSPAATATASANSAPPEPGSATAC